MSKALKKLVSNEMHFLETLYYESHMYICLMIRQNIIHYVYI